MGAPRDSRGGLRGLLHGRSGGAELDLGIPAPELGKPAIVDPSNERDPFSAPSRKDIGR